MFAQQIHARKLLVLWCSCDPVENESETIDVKAFEDGDYRENNWLVDLRVRLSDLMFVGKMINNSRSVWASFVSRLSSGSSLRSIQHMKCFDTRHNICRILSDRHNGPQMRNAPIVEGLMKFSFSSFSSIAKLLIVETSLAVNKTLQTQPTHSVAPSLLTLRRFFCQCKHGWQ